MCESHEVLPRMHEYHSGSACYGKMEEDVINIEEPEKEMLS